MNADLSLPARWRYERVPVNGVHIGATYSEHIQNKRGTLVLLHGFTGSILNWANILKSLDLPEVSVVALDMHGHGISDAPANPERYGMEYCQQDIIAVLQTLGIGRGEAILLGYSMGGRIALYSVFSSYFRALILESASPGLATSEEREARRLSDEALAKRIEQEGVETFVNDWEQLPLFANQRASLPKEIQQMQREQRLKNRARGLANSLRGIGTGVQQALHERLPELRVPTVVIAGALDTKFCKIGREMAEKIPQARLEIVPEAGHTVHLEQPDRFVRLVREFCLALLS